MIELSLVEILLFLSTGAFVGLLAGMLGVGGGLIVVPILLYVLPIVGIPPELVTHMAIATSLCTIVITSASSVRAHNRHGSVIWWVFKAMTPGVILGGLGGTILAHYLPSRSLKAIFGIFALLLAVQMFFKFKPSPQRKEPGKKTLFAAGSIIGCFSTLVGIGGGSITVPYLTYWNTQMSRAVGTSSAIGLPLSIAGTLGFIISGWNEPMRPSFSLGFVYLPAFLGIVMISSFTAPFGVRISQKISGKLLSRLFAGFLIVVGLDILLPFI